MKIQALGWMISVSAFATSFLSCSEPPVECAVGAAGAAIPYILKYTVKGTPSATCEKLIKKGEEFGFETYHPEKNTPDGVQVNFEETIVAIQSSDLGSLVRSKRTKLKLAAGAPVDPDASHKPYAIGNFASNIPGADGFCTIPTITTAEQDIPVVPAVVDDPKTTKDETKAAEPAIIIKYEWKNAKNYVVAGIPGTQFSGDLTYTQDTCTIEYHAFGLWPSVGCEETDADGNGTGKPDVTLCSPDADPSKGRATGSGINPDFPIECDPDLLLCVLKGEPPSLTPQK